MYRKVEGGPALAPRQVDNIVVHAWGALIVRGELNVEVFHERDLSDQSCERMFWADLASAVLSDAIRKLSTLPGREKATGSNFTSIVP